MMRLRYLIVVFVVCAGVAWALSEQMPPENKAMLTVTFDDASMAQFNHGFEIVRVFYDTIIPTARHLLLKAGLGGRTFGRCRFGSILVKVLGNFVQFGLCEFGIRS